MYFSDNFFFRWRHQARVERMNEQENKKKEIETERANNQKQLESVQQEIQSCGSNEEKLAQLQAKLKDFEAKKNELDAKFEELRLQEKKTPWNVDTISKPAFSKTIINKSTKPSYDDLSEEEKEVRMRDFVKDNKKLLEQFGMLRRYDDSKKFLLDHSQLACESTANYLVIWCINLQMEEKSMYYASFFNKLAKLFHIDCYFFFLPRTASLMEHVAHQCICMQYILELVSYSWTYVGVRHFFTKSFVLNFRPSNLMLTHVHVLVRSLTESKWLTLITRNTLILK